jgi:hypothetical protein
LVGALGVVDTIEVVDLGLKFLEGVGQGLLVQPPEQCLVESFVLALSLGVVGLARDRLHSQGSGVCGELADPTAAMGVQSYPIVGEETLGYSSRCHALVEDCQGPLTGLSVCDVGGDRHPGMVVFKLEDHALASRDEDVLGGVKLACSSWERGRRSDGRRNGDASSVLTSPPLVV